jgi:glycine betaine/proline transport system permease protein
MEAFNANTLFYIGCSSTLIYFGLGLGIAAYKSKRVEKALYPILLVMQTMPQYAVLVPALVLFGVGDHAAVIITMVVAVPPMILLTILGLRAIPTRSY